MNDLSSLPGQGPKNLAEGKKGACSSSHPLVTQTMIKVMKDGGNAIDAAIAGSLLQATIEPHMTNHGGSVLFLYWDAQTQKAYQLTSSGTLVPGLSSFTTLPGSSDKKTACIPGFMPGMGAMHQRFATRPWSDLCQPAFQAASEGYPMYSFQYGFLAEQLRSRTYFPGGRSKFTPDGFLPAVGELVRNPDLARTLDTLSREGPEYFTTGAWAQHFVEQANALGWPIELKHMSDIPPRWQEPLTYEHGDDTLVQLGPPEQAGVFSQFALGVLRHMKLDALGHYSQSANSLYLLAHALRWVSWELGLLQDPEIFQVPMEQWSSDEHHAYVARVIENSRPRVDLTEHVQLTAGKGGMEAALAPSGEADSCELSIVDPMGNWVQMLHSLQTGGIPQIAVDGVYMEGTSATPNLKSSISGWYTGGGRVKCIIGSTFVLRDGKPWMALGTPGRPHLTVPQVLHSILDFGMDPYEASVMPRLWPLGDDYTLEIESRISPEVVSDLARMGIQVKPLGTYHWSMGSFQICWKDHLTGTLKSIVDPRRVGQASAF